MYPVYLAGKIAGMISGKQLKQNHFSRTGGQGDDGECALAIHANNGGE